MPTAKVLGAKAGRKRKVGGPGGSPTPDSPSHSNTSSKQMKVSLNSFGDTSVTQKNELAPQYKATNSDAGKPPQDDTVTGANEEDVADLLGETDEK